MKNRFDVVHGVRGKFMSRDRRVPRLDDQRAVDSLVDPEREKPSAVAPEQAVQGSPGSETAESDGTPVF